MPTTFTDWVIVIGLPLTVIQTIFIALTYHNAKLEQATGAQPPASRRHLLIMSVLAIISWGLFAADHFFPRTETIFADSVLDGWRYEHGVFYVKIHGEQLQTFKNEYVLILYVKAFVPFADRMSDTHGIKSGSYSIENNIIQLSTSLTKDFCPLLSESHNTNIEDDIVLLPKKFSPEQITSLSSVEAMGGKIIAHPGHPWGYPPECQGFR